MLTGVSSCTVVTAMSLERYTRLLMDASAEFPIHFLNIYSSDRTDTRRVCAFAAGVCRVLYRTLSTGQDLGRPGTPTASWRGRQRRLGTDGRQAALHSHLSEDQTPANPARLVLQAAPIPDQRLDSSSAACLAARLRRA